MSKLVSRSVSSADRGGVSALLHLDSLALRSLIALGVTGLALALRWPHLLLIPRFTDETREAVWALQIAHGEHFPLTHFNAYIGAIHPYLLAALFRVFGSQPALPRVVAAVLGSLLAGLVAWLGWQFAASDPRVAKRTGNSPLSVAALLAGGLVATSFPLIAVNSHLGWSNCLTPFFTTLALAVTWSAVVRTRPWWLVLAGLLWGLALQTHPTVAALLPGVAAWIVLHPTGRAWLRTRWPWLAVAAFALGCGNMLWYNLTTHGDSIAQALDAGNAYQAAPTLAERVAAVGAAAVQLSRMLAGAYTIQPNGDFPVEMTPTVVLYGVLGLLALVWAARRIETAILPLAAVSSALLLPLVTNTFEGFHDTRYIAFLLPLVYLAVALAAVSTWEAWRSKAGARRVADVMLAAVSVLLVALPLVSLVRFYSDSEAYGLTNAPFVETAAAAQTQAANGSVVLLDSETSGIPLHGGGNVRRALEYLLTTNRTDFEIVPIEKTRWFLKNSKAPVFLILSDNSYAALASEVALTPTALRGPGFAAYTARPVQP